MNLESDPVRESLRSAVRARLRSATDESAWSALCAVGAPSFDAPTEAGGLGLGLAASTAIAEELGRSALPPHYLAVALAIDVAVGEPPLADKLVGGAYTVTLAGFDRPAARLCEVAAGGGRAGAGGAGAAAVWPSERGTVAVDAEPADLVLFPVARKDGRTAGLALLEWSTLDVKPGADPSGASLAAVAAVRADTPLLPRTPSAVARARIRQAAYLFGLGRGALAIGTLHASRRKQFDRPLRDFQSIAFRLAAAYVELEALRLAVARAAWLSDTGQPCDTDAAAALAQAAETATATISVVMQVCGVRAMTRELRAFRYYLRIRREATRLGRPGDLWREVGAEKLLGQSSSVRPAS